MDRRNVEDIYPLSPLQHGILFVSLLTGGRAYQEQFPMVLHGELVPDALERAFHALVARHGALRTGYVWEGVPQPLQFVLRQAAAPFDHLDWTSQPDWRAALAELMDADFRRGHDLKRPPLVRASLARMGDRRHLLLLAMHHVVADGWSIPLLFDELLTLYRADLDGVPADLPPAPRYRDYVQWLMGRDTGAAEAFWRRTMAGFTRPTPLPLDNGAPSTEEVFCETLDVDAEVMARAQAFARGQGVTLNTLVQGAWALLLGRYAGTRDVVFGATVSGRPPELPGVERAVGLYINTVPVRVALDDHVAVGDWLRTLQQAQAETRQYEYARLVDVHGWSGLPRDVKLFESMVVFENYPLGADDDEGDDGLRVEVLPEPERTGYGLALVCAPAGGRLQLRLTCDEARFSPQAARRLAAGVEAVLARLTADPARRLGTITTLSSEERATLEAWAQGPALPPAAGDTLHGAFAAHAVRAPHAPAVEDARVRWSYGELDARSRRLAARLAAAGVRPGMRVGVCMERGAPMIAAMLASFRACAAYVPLDPAYPVERLAFMVADSRAAALVVDEAAPRFEDFAGAVLRADEEEGGVDGAAWNDVEVGGEGEAYLIYTSGSTGRPKATAVPHRAVLRLTVHPECAVGPGDRVGQVVSTSFDGSVYEIWGTLAAGAASVVIDRDTVLDPAALAAVLGERGVTHVTMTTALFNHVARERPGAFATLRQIFVGGEAVDAAAFRAVLEAGCPELVNVYGPTEAAVFAVIHPVHAGELPEGAPVPIGRPIAGTSAWVLDDAGRPAPLGAAGELCVGGPALAHGYAGRPALTAERFVPDPFAAEPGARLYRTGDGVRWTEAGLMEFLGRIDMQVKVRGFRVEPGEVETALRAHPGVHDAAVGTRVDPSGSHGLVAWVVPGSVQGMDVAGLRAWLGERLPEWMVPSAWVVVDALPLTPNGKLDRAALPDPDGIGHGPAEEYVEPATETERELAELWREVLQVERVGARDTFFALGGHSLLGMQLASRVHQKLGVELPLRELFDHPRLADMAARVDEALEAQMLALLAEVEEMSDEEARALAAPGGEGG